MKRIKEIFEKVIIEYKGECSFLIPIEIDGWQIDTIKAYRFRHIHESEEWNEYVKEFHKISNAKQYITWVRDENFKVVGSLVFYDGAGKELKMKHFTEWTEIYNKL